MIRISIIDAQGNEIESWNLPYCPSFAEGQKLTINVDVKDRNVWSDDVQPHTGEYVITKIEHYARKNYVHKVFEYWTIIIHVEPVKSEASLFGFGGIAQAAAMVAKVLFYIFIVMVLVLLIFQIPKPK
jgi:uncharacterized membrane protein YtjA (UPF0391 family)